jgi:rod shape-determining protein MreB
MNLIEKIIYNYSDKVLLDMGTSNIKVSLFGTKDILIEPSIVIVSKSDGKSLFLGDTAKLMLGRISPNMLSVQPLKAGAITNFDATESLVRYIISKVKPNFNLFSKILGCTVLMGVPTMLSEVEINAAVDAAKLAGGRLVYVFETPVLNSLGLQININEPQSNLIVDIGGGITDISVIYKGEIVIDNTIKIGGDDFDLAIVEYIKSKYSLLIPLKSAEDLKNDGASISLKKTIKNYNVQGQDLITGLPKSITISDIEIGESIIPIISKLAKSIVECIEKSPPEIVSDLISKGIFITGGLSMIQNLDKYLESLLKLKVNKSQNPLNENIYGLANIAKNMKYIDKLKLKDLLIRE